MSNDYENYDDYIQHVNGLFSELADEGKLRDDDINVILNYVDRLESLISELASKTGFADDHCGGWQAYIAEEYT